MKKIVSVILSVTMLCGILYLPLTVGAAELFTGGKPTLLTNEPVTDEIIVDNGKITLDNGKKRDIFDHSTANNHPTWSKNKDTINGETVVYQEPVLFYTDNGNVRSNVKLMYPVENIVAVTSYTTIDGVFKWYRKDTDFTVNIDGTISLTAETTIPRNFALNEMKTENIWNAAGKWQSQLPQNQVLVTYTYTKTWDGVDYSVPTYYNSISTAYDKLSNGDTLDVLFIGDSISTGCNASGQDGVFYTYNPTSVGNTTTLQGWNRYLGLSAKPYWVNDSWDKQVVANIKAAYPNATINVKNRSVGSSASQWYFNHIDELLVTGSLGDVGLENTDLIFIGFGMNEWSVAAATQNANTKKIIDYLRQKNPNVSIVLVSAFYPTVWDPNNQKWTNYRLGEQEDGYFELAKEYENIAVAPVNTAFVNILKAKEGVDYIANGINHPNDYGVNLYADVITATLKIGATDDTCSHNYTENVDAEYLKSAANCGNGAVYYKSCSVCGAKSTETFESGDVDSGNHVGGTYKKNEKPATCFEKGYTGDTWCLDCNKKIAEGKDIEKLEHKPVLVKAEEATAAEEGNIEYYYCENCGKYYSDKAGTKEIAEKDTVVSKLAPKIIDGNNAKIDKSSKEPVSFRSDASFDDFIRVELDGKELVKDKDYTLKEGSIIVTLTPEFLATLPAGDHTLSIVSVSGTANADFSVTAEKADDTSSDKENSEKSPQTRCDINAILWSLAGIISLTLLSVFGIFKKRLCKSR